MRDYLNRAGKNVEVFKDNMPDKNWLNAYLRRHSEDLAMRKCNMLKRSWGNITRPEVQEFFDRYSKTAEGVEPKNIWNYDETNLRDDPSTKIAIFKRGCKYAEYI